MSKKSVAIGTPVILLLGCIAIWSSHARADDSETVLTREEAAGIVAGDGKCCWPLPNCKQVQAHCESFTDLGPDYCTYPSFEDRIINTNATLWCADPGQCARGGW